jgi:hypothetical protein
VKFTRPRIVTRTVTGTDANGHPTTVPAISQTELADLILGDGTTHTVRKRTKTFEISQESDSVVSVPITTAAFADIEQPINGNSQIFLTVNIVALGALSGVTCRLEFQDPDHPEFWIPSKEGINREADAATHNWVLNAVGNHVLASRVEHNHFRKFRARFQANVANADATTEIVVSWHHNGKVSGPEDAQNDPDAPDR